ncbi:hypothetical protein AVEN_221362-1 [Araneus ventricosus]|uniref:Uncharacterized protein n=1 Tax=Araneus ventricosus TaxID=182803 RepID=A0A4Y2B263_ARAVE|nr:hypothetical protein AVEN_221362-1 [Araneus ventricosus]
MQIHPQPITLILYCAYSFSAFFNFLSERLAKVQGERAPPTHVSRFVAFPHLWPGCPDGAVDIQAGWIIRSNFQRIFRTDDQFWRGAVKYGRGCPALRGTFIAVQVNDFWNTRRENLSTM